MHQKDRLNFNEILYLVNAPLVEGDAWYFLDKNWYDKCKAYHTTGDQSSFPGPINNSALFQTSPNSTAHPTTVSTNNITSTTTTTTATTTTNNISPPVTSTSSVLNANSDNAEAAPVAGKPKLPSEHASGDSAVERQLLREDIMEQENYIFVPEQCWNILKDHHGLVDETHEIKRHVIEVSPGNLIVEAHYLKLKLCLYGGKEAIVEKSFTRKTTVEELQQEIRKIFNVSPTRETKLWINNEIIAFKPKQEITNNELSLSKSENNLQATLPTKLPPTPPPMPNGNNGSSSLSSHEVSPNVITRQAANSMSKTQTEEQKALTYPKTLEEHEQYLSDLILSSNANQSKINSSSTLMDVNINSVLFVTLEVINADGTWPSCRPRFGTVSTRSSKAQPGLCGLSNMGNTCFMNAALQCLSNTPPLTDYILSNKYVDDINSTNPLGMHGEIARTYAELIKVMWSGNSTSFLPREFKCAVSRFAPQFYGFTQQDSQELMAFLLDGLHEDLNRIRNKPYIEIKNDIELRPDEVVAEESWSNYKKRNDSIVVDTFHAMLKSTLVCPGCNLVSVTFDPFCYLSLPLPVTRDKQVNLALLPAPGKLDQEASKQENDSTIPKVTPRPTLQLKDCISQFTNVERLGADDPWYCPKCKKHQQATKKFDIWSLPKVLIIHLKRFSFSRSWRDKIDTLVEFPIEGLDMSEYVLNPKQKQQKQIYNLIGVSNHFGGLGGGHYTAYAKNAVQDAWYSFDDALVTQTSSSNVLTRSAYVLFYQLQENA